MESLVNRIAPYRYLIIDLFGEKAEIFHPKAEFVKRERSRVWLRFEKSCVTAAELIADLSRYYQIKDISVEEADIEDVVRQVYSEARQVSGK